MSKFFKSTPFYLDLPYEKRPKLIRTHRKDTTALINTRKIK